MSQIKITIADNQQLISKWCQTQEKYAHKHHKIAILPAIFEDKKFTENISDDEKKNTFT